LRLPDPRIIKLDRETGYGISRWSAHHQIFNGMMPYMLIVTLCMIIMYFWPGMTLWLPNYLYNN
jgi:TRAP-type mannitol/chloroaromatic compound transport system permease large subunit